MKSFKVVAVIIALIASNVSFADADCPFRNQSAKHDVTTAPRSPAGPVKVSYGSGDGVDGAANPTPTKKLAGQHP